MPLTSLDYLFFLGFVTFFYYSIKPKLRLYVLLAASFTFYLLNQGWYVAFLLTSILVNYWLCALWLKTRIKWLIYIAISYNILVLGFFKYIPVILYGSSVPQDSIWSRLILPIGISFYSFQAIGYVLDMYWKGGKSQASISHFSLYMSFFPQLLSGPIARGKDFLPQIGLERSLEYDNVASGARLILWGLFKKLVIADNLSPYTDAVFNNLHSHSGLTLIIAMFAYTVQVYMDFSGYSDIAIGSAKILGFKLLENFRTPYFAQSVTDFWRRWHISLSSWVRDYVNTPLQYRFRSFGLWGILGSAFITFFIIGIWHGAYWNYVLFGLIQGAAITYEVLTQKVRAGFWKHIPSFICNALSNIVVFFFFSLSVILLRTSVANAILFYSKMSFDPQGLYLGSKQLIIYSAIGFGVVLCVELMARGQIIVDYFRRQGTILRWFYYVSCSLLILILGSLSSENFIYFQF